MLSFLRSAPAPLVDARPCAVYAAYNHAGEIIYVGISCDPDERWEQHEAGKPWAGEVAWWQVLASYGTRAEAKAHETYLIRTLCTRWNIDESPVADEVRATYQREFGQVPGVTPRRELRWPVRLLLWVLKALLWVAWTLLTGVLQLLWVVVARSLGVRRRRRRRRRFGW